MTTPFDDPQAELAWMFLQNLGDDGDLDEAFDLLDDGTLELFYTENRAGVSVAAASPAPGSG